MRKVLFILSILSVFSISQASQSSSLKTSGKSSSVAPKKNVVTKTLTKKSSATKSKTKSPKSVVKNIKNGKKPKSEKVLSYYQWRQLNKKDQAKYIRGLQKISYRWEEGQRFFGITQADHSSVNKWALLSEMLINPSRAADPSHCSKIHFKYANGEICYSGGWWWSLTHCPSKVPEAKSYTHICEEKFLAFVREQGAAINAKNPEDFAKFEQAARDVRRPYTSENGRTGAGPTVSANAQESVPEGMADAQEVVTETPQCSEGEGLGCTEVRDNEVMTEERRQAYRSEMRELFSPGQQPCVIAGFVSVLNENMKCVPVRQKSVGGWSGSCGSGETMCNPLLFGFSREGQPLCVSLHMNVTAACHAETAEYGNTPEVISAQLSGSSGIESLNRITTEDFADFWQAQRVGMGQLCTEKTQSLSFFCVECGIMNSRVRQINQSASCADQCGRITQDGPCSGGSSAPAPSSDAGGTQ